MIELQWLLNHTDTAKNVNVSVLSQETSEDIEELKNIIGKGVLVTFDLLREPLQELGIEMDMMRAIPSRETKEAKQFLERLQEDDA